MTDVPNIDSQPSCRQCTTGRQNQLFARLWQPVDQPTVGCVVIVHGLGEHGGRYEPVVRQLASFGWASLVADLPGHGRSPGRRGHAPSYFGMLRDIDAMRSTAQQMLPTVPQVLLGHSMGGNLAANYVIRRSELDASLGALAGLVLSGPMFLPTNPPNRTQVFAAWATGYLVPWLTVRTPVDINKLTRNPSTAKAIRSDDLVHGRISVYIATQLLAQGRFALDHAAAIQMPTLVMHGEKDPITSYRASESFAIRAGEHVKFVSFPGMLHEIFHETEAVKVYQTLRSWLTKLVGG